GVRRFLALLDHLGEQAKHIVVGNAFARGFGARGDVLVLERGVDHAKRRDALLILRLHRLFQLLVEPLAQAHGRSPLLPNYCTNAELLTKLATSLQSSSGSRMSSRSIRSRVVTRGYSSMNSIFARSQIWCASMIERKRSMSLSQTLKCFVSVTK